MENKISLTKNILIVLDGGKEQSKDFEYLINHFCGRVVHHFLEIKEVSSSQVIYVCGDISILKEVNTFVYLIEELSYNYSELNKENYKTVTLGKVPININSAGVYFRHLFDDDNYFNSIKTEHEFQQLTESNKPSTSLRKGIYLTEVLKEETKANKELLHYRLLRCSSNLTGPTDNFRETDKEIIKALNIAANQVFDVETELNHVLAQIYENKKKAGVKAKETKARIKAHSDKTKDMRKDGLIAFCTFYDNSNFEHLKQSDTDRYDWSYKNRSGLTSLHFKLKNSVTDDSLEKAFSVTLYPNSVFLIPLSTNRLYTHEIKPSILNIDRIPVRMGYVVRSSKAEAVYMDNQAYIKENGALVKLEEMTEETMTSLRDSYYEENKTEHKVEYGKVHFSMNLGDYKKPIL